MYLYYRYEPAAECAKDDEGNFAPAYVKIGPVGDKYTTEEQIEYARGIVRQELANMAATGVENVTPLSKEDYENEADE